MHAWSRKKLLQMLNLQIKAKKKKKKPLEAGEQNFWLSLHSQASVGCHETHKAHGCVQERVGVMGAPRYSAHCHETQIC